MNVPMLQAVSYTHLDVYKRQVLPSRCFLFPREGIKGTRAVIWKSPQDYGSTNSYHYFLRDNQHQEKK